MKEDVHNHVNVAVPASNFTFDELAEIYNQTRIDYIVPMPMNGKRMRDYVNDYDIDMDASVITLTEADEPTGIGMVALRDERAWITRLGVSPHFRGRRVGSFLMDNLLNSARVHGAARVQLEVIVGNDPARRLFEKYGLTPTRELLVVRRPPGSPHPTLAPPGIEVTEIAAEDIPVYLQNREIGASWVEETQSLLNAGGLRGIILMTHSGGEGWAIFQQTPFQLQHVVLYADIIDYDRTIFGLLYAMHALYPNRDTKVENIPTDHPTWPHFERCGYVVSFRRIEMTCDL